MKELNVEDFKQEVKEWSVGTYVVFLEDKLSHSRGFVDEIVSNNNIEINLANERGIGLRSSYIQDLKWFPTKELAQAFSDSLLGIKKDSIPEYVEWINYVGLREDRRMCTKSEFKEGKIFCTKTDNFPDSGLSESIDSWKLGYTKSWYKHNFKPSTLEAYNLQNKPKEELSLLEQAKLLYPIGTRYKNATGFNEELIVESMDWYKSPSNTVYGESGKGCLYIDGQWAEILETPKNTACEQVTGSFTYEMKIPLTVKESYNSFELGDEVEVIKPCLSGNHKKGYKNKIKSIEQIYLTDYGACTGVCLGDGYYENIKDVKLIKKHNIQSTQTRKVEFPHQVGNTVKELDSLAYLIKTLVEKKTVVNKQKLSIISHSLIQI